MDSIVRSPGWWPAEPPRPPARSIVELIRAGTLDAELAALLWLLVEARLPLVVAARLGRTGKSTMLSALLDFLPPGTHRHELRGVVETFDWLPHARELGWLPPRPTPGDTPTTREREDPSHAYLVAAELSDHLPAYTWGDAARVAVRAITVGYGLGATIHADSLEEVFDLLHRPPVALTDDELSRLGVVVIMRAFPPPAGDLATGPVRRVTAVHYVRPVSRDVHGHLQRLPPAVVATWNPDTDAFEHFSWGATTELAERVGRRAGDFEAEHERRRAYLEGLAEAGVVEVDAVRAAIEGYRSVDRVASPN